MMMSNRSGIHIGEKIHHQDQVATTPTFANLRVRKIKNSTVLNPRPVDVVDFVSFAISFYL
jgi:hypothetical protein